MGILIGVHLRHVGAGCSVDFGMPGIMGSWPIPLLLRPDFCAPRYLHNFLSNNVINRCTLNHGLHGSFLSSGLFVSLADDASLATVPMIIAGRGISPLRHRLTEGLSSHNSEAKTKTCP